MMYKNLRFLSRHKRILFRFLTPAQKRRIVTQDILRIAARQRAMLCNIQEKPAETAEKNGKDK